MYSIRSLLYSITQTDYIYRTNIIIEPITNDYIKVWNVGFNWDFMAM